MSSSVVFVGHDRFSKILKNHRETKKIWVWVQTRGILQNNLCKNNSIRENLLLGGIGCVATKSNLFINSVLKDQNITYFENLKLNSCTYY